MPVRPFERMAGFQTMSKIGIYTSELDAKRRAQNQ
jgi:hypothetical protein